MNNSFTQLNPDCHTFVRDLCHTYNITFSPQELRFIEIAYDKLQLTGEYFSKSDFPILTANNFSQIIHRINKKINLITKEVHGKSPLFSLKGVHLDQSVRERHTGVNHSFINQKLEQLYSLAKKQPPFMHDIKLSSRTMHLYDTLLKRGTTPHPSNKQFHITIKIPTCRFNSKVSLSPNGRIDLHIGCSQFYYWIFRIN